MHIHIGRLTGLCFWLLAGTCLSAPGDIDTSFGQGGSIPAGTVLPMPDGRLAVILQIGSGFVVSAYDAMGNELEAGQGGFGAPGTTFVSVPGITLAGPATLGADGKLLFSGERPRSDGSKVRTIIRLTSQGAPDPSFGTQSNGTADLPDFKNIVGLAGLQDGRTLVLEWSPVCGSDGIGISCNGPLAVWRLLPNGSLDPAFGVKGVAPVPESDITGDWVALFGVRPDGSILVGDNSFLPTLTVLTPNGSIDTNFNAATAKSSEAWWHRGAMLPDGGLLLAGVAGPGTRVEDADTRLMKLRPDGRVDTSFGNGSGVVTLNLSAVVSARTDLIEQWPEIALSPDGSLVYLRTIIQTNIFDSGYSCPAVARVNASGVLDAGFGQRGVSCVTKNDDRLLFLDRLSIQASGQPLLAMASTLNPAPFPPAILRLRVDSSPSPGIINIRSAIGVDESIGTLAIKVARTAGKSGAISISYATESVTAIAGEDYVAASGHLDWADGDDTERTILISIRNDTLKEQDIESFVVRLSSPTGGPLIIGSPGTMNIYDNDSAVSTPPAVSPTPTPPATTPVSNTSGGGGAVPISTLIFLTCVGALRVRRRRNRSQRAALSQSAPDL